MQAHDRCAGRLDCEPVNECRSLDRLLTHYSQGQALGDDLPRRTEPTPMNMTSITLTAAPESDFQVFDAGNVVLQSGRTFRNMSIAYKTFGSLNASHTIGEGSQRYTVYGEAHEGGGNSEQNSSDEAEED